MIQKYRQLVQSLSLIALHSSWGPQVKWLCNPVLSCHSCALAWFACPIGIWVHYSAYQIFPFLAIGTVLLLGALFGRLLCGWVCPFGFIQDLLYKIPTRKIELPRWTSNIKYIVLVAMVFLAPFYLGEATQLSFCRYCPASALEVTLPNLVMGVALTFWTGIKLGVLIMVLALVIYGERAFCRLFCPIGAFLAPLNLASLWFVRPAQGECLTCEQCDKRCPTHIQPSEKIARGESPSRALDCIVCHQCQPYCPQWKKERKGRAAHQAQADQAPAETAGIIQDF